jgi:anti-sigma28 factor (negative regulator of flagellin synthesis)
MQKKNSPELWSITVESKSQSAPSKRLIWVRDSYSRSLAAQLKSLTRSGSYDVSKDRIASNALKLVTDVFDESDQT